MYSGIFHNPFLIWGKYRKKFFRYTLPISLQFHHTQMDGAHAGRFLENLQRELADRQVRAPFAGTITSVSRLKEGDVSEFGTGIMTLVDSTMS